MSSGLSVADSASTNVKALVATDDNDQDFVYKKHDNYIVLLFKIKLPENFKIEENKEFTLGFQIMTSCNRYNQDDFDITTPIFMNIGALKLDQPKPQQQP